MTNFITNTKKSLQSRLVELIKNSDELKFLVGFFYFSGLQELFEGLKENPDVILKILVGLKVEKFNYQLVELSYRSKLSIAEIEEQFADNLKVSLTVDDYDNQEQYEQIRYFIKMIKNDRLIIRKTREPNHAKIYLFNIPMVGYSHNSFITGSSNLTRAGLKDQAEFNVEISDYGTEETEQYFDNLWKTAVPLTEEDVNKREIIDIIETGSLIREVTPFEAYALAMKTYLDAYKPASVGDSLIDVLKNSGYTPYQYQLDAVSQALSIIDQNNGVIIADVVGLGKTIIACAIGHELKKRGVVICPPGLIGDKNKNSGWRMYLEQFNLKSWEVRSAGDLEKTAEFVQKTNDIEVIIIDEAHRFRNQNTKDYEFLRNICRNKIVILLTATPFNNRPADILSLLKLFITPKKSNITLQSNLDWKFSTYRTVFERLSFIRKNHNSTNREKRQKAETYYLDYFDALPVDLVKVRERTRFLANEIRDVIEPVTIRRNRLDLLNNASYKIEVNNLSIVADPQEWYFELSLEQSKFYDQILKEYFGNTDEGGRFTGAMYKPFVYEIPPEKELSEEENFEYFQQQNLLDFMRRLLVRRFESSFGSFHQSIKRFRRITKRCLDFAQKTGKYIMNRELMDDIYDKDLDEIEEKLEQVYSQYEDERPSKRNRIYQLDKFHSKEIFLKDMQSDIDLFDEILAQLDKMDLINNDPKGDCLIENIHRVLEEKPAQGEPKRKVIIFTEYVDTLKHLDNKLKPEFGDRMLTVEKLSNKEIPIINQNFDASHQAPKDEYDILLATDRISEGFNLNRAGMVINYDVPWNPIRVIQRLGRINRISKKVFSTLYIVNFFPTEKGAEKIKSREIAASKMFLIHSILGEDAKIFDVDEEPTPADLFTRINKNPDDLEKESFYTRMLNRFEEIKEIYPDLIKNLNDFPLKVKVAKAGKTNEQLVLFKKGRLFLQGVQYDGESAGQVQQYSFEETLQKIECSPEEPRLELSDRFWENYELAKKINDDQGRNPSGQSREFKARSNLKTLQQKRYPALQHLENFINILIEDIDGYGTLPDYTLSRIAGMETTKNSKIQAVEKELTLIRQELGEDYLEKEKSRVSKTRKEIIIAIENRLP